MTASEQPGPSGQRPDQGGPQREGLSTGLVAMVLVALSAAALFAAGLSLGSQTAGRDAGERADLEAFLETYRAIADDYVGEVESEQLLEGALRGMFEILDDPYSTYMDPDEYEATFAGINGEFEGIGIRVSAEDESGASCEPIDDDCRLLVIEVLAESPALGAGLRRDDAIVAVDERSLDGATIDDAVMLIRGPGGSDVTLTLLRDGSEQELRITRDTILSEDVRSAVLADGLVGYLRVDSFSSRAADDFEESLREQLDAGIERFVVDVRDDPGGFVNAAVAITSEFLADGAVFWEEDADGAQRSVETRGDGVATGTDLRVVVLVDDGSASASEIFAGALQDAGRAQLVGEPTFGKGTVQEWTQLPGGNGGFRLSVAKWLTRDKRWVHGTGLTPDLLVDGGDERYRPGGGGDGRGSDAQLARALALLLDEEGATGPLTSPAPGASPSKAPAATPAAARSSPPLD